MNTIVIMHTLTWCILQTRWTRSLWRAQLTGCTCAQIWCTDWILVRSWFLNYLSAVEKPIRSRDTEFQYYFKRLFGKHICRPHSVTTRKGGCGLQVESNYVLEGCTLHRYRTQWKAAENEGQLCIRRIHRYRIRRTIMYRNDIQV